ncbi:predicted protein [Postia placenta Mad-698-R]|nr:predicted protein [Postia placenta Mad-698-R]
MSDTVHDDHPRTLTILFATETGTAQEIADRVAMQCRRIHVQARILSMDSYSPAELISEKMVIFSVATTGSGKEPRAMTRLWNMLLRSDLPEDLFEDLSFAVFGLGDTAYEKFCWPAKLLSRRLASLGATEISARGEGDEQHPLGFAWLLCTYLDISAVPRRSFFAMLRHFVSDKLEEEKLDEFLSPEGADELYDYCQKPRRTIREVLEEFRSARIPREYIFDVFPTLRPRQFSIASSMKAGFYSAFCLRHPRQIHLCIAIVRYKTMLKVPRRGVCTDYLVHLKPGDRLPIGLQKGLFALPPDTATPIICVGPGTGVAPMRSIIEERTFLGSIANTLYLGCRSAHKDQHYATEWEAYVVAGSLTYRPAFSRDEPEGAPRRYVQDLIREDSKRTWELLGVQRGWIYISGYQVLSCPFENVLTKTIHCSSANKMPAGVKAAIMHAAQTEGAKTKEQAQDFVWMLEREGRLVEECWS